MNPLEGYIQQLFQIRATGAGVKETSYYGALENLFNEGGKGLKPKVRCVMQLQNRGAGIPDGGLFTAEQLQKGDEGKPFRGQAPARGVIEAKGTGADNLMTANSEQVKKYLDRYGQVLVTNLRDFVLVEKDGDGRAVMLEAYSLAPDEDSFWRVVRATPQRMVEEHGTQFVEYLKRVMLHAAPLASPVDVAWFLASYARDAKARIEGAEMHALRTVRASLESTLGLAFEGEKGDHFFKSTLVQTLFYGMFSAWVLWSKGQKVGGKERFDWKDSGWYLQVPIIQALFEEVGTKSKLGPLGLVEVMEWAGNALNRVDREAFFARFEEEHAVQYFYEPFLEAFDPELRKDLGVWYTPPEIVKYMVARVDRVLREELGVEDGLADERVTVLDPACGTGAYLVEVLRKIEETLREKGEDALLGHALKRAATGRVHGFEILPAPFVVAHLQLGLMLQKVGAPLSEVKGERAGVYLTNSLTGWEGHSKARQSLLPQLEEERDAAEKVKQSEEILVVIGNPPYNAFAGTSPEQEKGLVEPYKEGLISKWGIKKFNLDDLYVRFFRLGERRIAEMNKSGKGVVCFISNHSWISDPSFVVLRQHLLASFDRFWVENMHGNRKISEYAPDGRTSETVFAMPGQSAGIQQGVAISLWVKSGRKHEGPQVLFRDDLNAARAVERRAQLLASLKDEDFEGQYGAATPNEGNKYSFRPSDASSEYMEWPKLVEMCAEAPSNGLMEKRGGALIDTDKESLERRMRMYYDDKVGWEEIEALRTGLTENAAGYEAKYVRPKIQAAERFRSERVLRYALRPFDTRWCFYSTVSPLWNRSRPSLWAQYWEGNSFILTRFNAAKEPEGSPSYFTSLLSDDHFLTPDAVAIPLRLRASDINVQTTMFSADKANLSPSARAYLAAIGIADPDADAERAGLVWMHALAIGYSLLYLGENADGIRQDWPRVPLPGTREGLERSAALGRRVAMLLDTERGVPGVTSGALRPEMRVIGAVQHVKGKQLNPDEGDLDVKAGWGHGGQGGVTMPGKGKSEERAYTEAEMAAIAEGAAKLGLSVEEVVGRLGERTRDVYLNGVAYWRNVPQKVWDYTIGGYQVMKKWLSYREMGVLGRALKVEEVQEVTNMARRIAAIVLMEGELDANYEAAKGGAYGWDDRGQTTDNS